MFTFVSGLNKVQIRENVPVAWICATGWHGTCEMTAPTEVGGGKTTRGRGPAPTSSRWGFLPPVPPPADVLTAGAKSSVVPDSASPEQRFLPVSLITSLCPPKRAAFPVPHLEVPPALRINSQPQMGC